MQNILQILLKLRVRTSGRSRRRVWWIPIASIVFALVAGVGQASAITRVSTSTVVNTTTTSVVSVATPSQTQSGDVLVACLALNGGNVASSGVPSGWKSIASVTAISNPHVFGYYKVAGNSEPASYSWTLTSAVANGAGIARYTGVDNTSPLDTAVATASGASATSGTIAGVTTVTANTMLAGCMGINSSSTAVTITAPTGMSQAWNIGGKRHQFADGPQAATGASGPKTWTFSATREWAGWLVALRPATTSTPINTVAPTISATPVVGATVTATTGTWTSATTITGYTYQWQTSPNATTWTNATGTGAATNSYTVASADAGMYLHVVVTATNSVGSTSAASASTAMIAPYNSALPATCAAPAVGVACAATNGTWAGASTYSYQWQTSPDTITWTNATGTGATTNSYIPAAADAGLYLHVIVTATNSGGSMIATSPPSVAVIATPPSNTALPTISGTTQAGQTLSASTGTWSGSPTITYTYQWQRCDSAGATCGPISAATGVTYTLATADVGSTIRVVVTATNTAGSSSATSNATTVVQAATVTPFVALWHMDETSGTVMYDSAGTHNGTLHSILLGLPGFSGTAYGLNGSSSYVSVPSSSDLNPGSANLTVTIHLKTTTAPASPDWDLIRKGVYASVGGEFKMEYQPGGQASCGFNGSSSYSELQAGPALNDGNWHTVQCVKTASAIQVVVDGVIYSKAATIGTIGNTDPVVIGSHAGTSEFFNGSLDEASIQIW